MTVLLICFAAGSFVLSGSTRWPALFTVVAVATVAAGFVMVECERALDQRRGIARLVVIALVVCLLPPIFLASTYGEYLESRALMRVNLMLIWLVVGLLLWSILDRLRRRHLNLTGNATVAIAVAVLSLGVMVLPPIPGISNVGKPLTVITHYRLDCPGSPPVPPDGDPAELETSTGDVFASETKKGEARFEDVPYFAKTRNHSYLDVPPDKVATPDDDGSTVMSNGDLRISTPWTYKEPVYGYLTILSSLVSAGALEQPTLSSITWTIQECS
jgi:hypothetical protein